VAAPAAAEIGTGARARRSPRRRQTEANMWARWIEVVLRGDGRERADVFGGFSSQPAATLPR
jgi:hypothetical protein